MSDRFAPPASRLAGAAGAWFGWRPDEFWAATPDELAALFSVLARQAEAPPATADIARLKERFPDG